MKRQLKFDFENGSYVLRENDHTVFSIDGNTLKFVALDFYNSLYRGKSAAIEVSNAITNDELKKGAYIFNWLSQIVNAVQDALNDPEPEDQSEEQANKEERKLVFLFELAACAGEGFFSDGPSGVEQRTESPYYEADYAVRISGKSMEPTIADGSIVYVKRAEQLSDGDIGIFIVDGNVMCKRYREDSRVWLQPDNSSPEYSPKYIDENTECIIQGKVLLR